MAQPDAPTPSAPSVLSKVREKLPDKPLLVTGAVGGPLVIWLCTPLRNGLTLGSKDKTSNFAGLYRKVFRGGPHAGWTGGLAPAVVACPQFLLLGPLYHLFNTVLSEFSGCGQLSPTSGPRLGCSAVAALGSALGETVMTFGSQSRNAQMACPEADRARATRTPRNGIGGTTIPSCTFPPWRMALGETCR
ncbi:unnamed protein product [Effrenium voratum]|nr:unnamed protein product [Effrenium voratum]